MRHVFPTRSARRARSQAGFTLVEMMIALLAGSFAIMAVYYLGGVSSRGFNEQSRVAESQMALRTAMEQLRRDISLMGEGGERPDRSRRPTARLQ